MFLGLSLADFKKPYEFIKEENFSFWEFMINSFIMFFFIDSA